LNARRARRVLVAAFALSLLLHLAVAYFLHPNREPTPNEVERVTIRHMLALTKRPTPPPLPKRTPVPHPAPTSRPAPRASKAALPVGARGGLARASAAPTAPPTPAPTAVPSSCAKPVVVAAEPAPPHIPLSVRAQGTSGIASIAVRVDARGAVTAATVAQSTGNPGLDAIGVALAREATYTPATVDCKPVAGSYTFRIKFAAW
jgi:TonB family protein